MTARRIILNLALMCFCVFVYAEEGIIINDLIGVKEVKDENLEVMTCSDLYATATILEPETQNYRSTLLNENTGIVVSTLGTIYKPALFAYTLTIPWHFREDYRQVHTSHTLDNIRQRMSALNCFQK